MARIVKEAEYAARRKEILDVAQRFVYTKGYEQMSIQDILDELQISKGAFYHYFSSKSALLEALIERMMDEAESFLLPIVQDPHLAALEKLHRYFDTANRWKVAQKAYMLALLQVWYADENAIVRQKVFTLASRRIAPMLTRIIHQGIQEGVLKASFSEHAGEVVFSLFQGLADTFAGLLLSCGAHQDELRHTESTLSAYMDALERILGAPTGSLHLIDAEMLKEWFTAPSDNA
ncbi:MAG: TetR/AcrR family transcriptional regulator [Chloroflexi bacterium]|nr:TetR/AcrR family transcriptional regulator [Chloroflexota bacterium]